MSVTSPIDELNSHYADLEKKVEGLHGDIGELRKDFANVTIGLKEFIEITQKYPWVLVSMKERIERAADDQAMRRAMRRRWNRVEVYLRPTRVFAFAVIAAVIGGIGFVLGEGLVSHLFPPIPIPTVRQTGSPPPYHK